MIINKIGGITNTSFKSIDYVKTSTGETNYVFNMPDWELQIFKATPDDRYNYHASETPVLSTKLDPEGTIVDLLKSANIANNEPFFYNYVKRDENGKIIATMADTSNKMKLDKNGVFVNRVSDRRVWNNGAVTNEYQDTALNYTHTLVTRKGTTPISGTAAELIMPDSFMPEMRFYDFDSPYTGKIYSDKSIKNKVEGKGRAFSTLYGGNLAGIISYIPTLKKNGIGTLILPPIANGDDITAHGYWNKNNNMAPEYFDYFIKELYKNNMRFVFDGTFTSQGLEGINFQYALRWANKNPQSYYWFRMPGIKNQSLGFGVIPENSQNLRHRVINPKYNYELQSDGTYKRIPNKNYNPNKETIPEIYDAALTSEEQLKKLDTPIRKYENLKSQADLDIVSHEDTNINYSFEIDPEEYDARVKVINDLNKHHGQNIRLDSPEGTIMALQFPNFKIDKKTEGGFVTWDANTDMVKLNYQISGYDEKILQSIVDENQRYEEQQKLLRGTKEVQDMAIQTARYWTERVKDIQTIYTAQKIGKIKTLEDLNKLIEKEELPSLPIGRGINNETFANILNGQYLLEPKGILDKDSVTIKSLMKLPLDSLEFGENIQGVLSTSYFSNRATSDETLGKTRFELFKENNPHLVKEYASVYNKVDKLYTNELKNFADSVIKEVNKSSNEKLLDSNGNYTEYGEYVVELIGKDIAKYALLKSLAGENFRAKILDSGELTYDYKKIKDNTTLKSLKIKANNPEEEASILQKKIKKGLANLSQNDIKMVADSINQQIKGTDTTTFRLSEAFVDRASIGLNWRLDAAKDVMDMDSVRNRDDNFDVTWDNLIKFWSKVVQAIKEKNPNAYIVAEMTDISDLMRDTTGNKKVWPYNGDTNIGQKFNGEPDAMAKFFNETGITSEAAYAFFFTNLLNVFSNNFENGTGASITHDSFKDRLDLLLETKSVDNLRNLYTFMGNQDKPRMVHGLAVDISLFHSSVLHNYDKFSNPNEFNRTHTHRMDIIRVLSGAKSMNEVPIELRLNVDNNDYFRTVSSRAVAQSKLLMDSVYEDLKGIASEDDIKLIVQALADLADGNFLYNKASNNHTLINIPELSTVENAFGEILKLAERYGLKLSETEKSELINKIKEQVNKTDLSDYTVYGEFSWTDNGIGDKHKENLRALVGSDANANNTDIYVLQLARLLNDSYNIVGDSKYNAEIKNAAKDFVEKYNKDFVNQHKKEPKLYEPKEIAMKKKNGYASKDFIAAMELAIKQAEFKSGRKIVNKNRIIATVFQSVTEPAVQKAAMIMEYLKGLIGIPTMYGGDELGLTGYEEKAKNIYLQNRLWLPFSDLERNDDLGLYRQRIYKLMTNTLEDRSNIDLHSLNDGTPYSMDVSINNRNRDEVQQRIVEINKQLEGADSKTKEKLLKEKIELINALACVALLRHSANGGDVTVSLFNAAGVYADNRHNYFNDEIRQFDTEQSRRKYFEDNNINSINPNNKYVPILPKAELDYILLGAGISLPTGMILINSNKKDKSQYIVKTLENGKQAIVKKGGGKIIMDGLTSKNGVMILTNAIKRFAFRGNDKRIYNKQFNITPNGAYSNKNTAILGERLHLTTKK